MFVVLIPPVFLHLSVPDISSDLADTRTQRVKFVLFQSAQPFLTWGFFVCQQCVWCICCGDPGEALCIVHRQRSCVEVCTDHCDLKLWHTGPRAKNCCRCWPKPSSALHRSPEWTWQISPHYHSCPFRGLCSLVISPNKSSADTISSFLVVLINRPHLLLRLKLTELYSGG